MFFLQRLHFWCAVSHKKRQKVPSAGTACGTSGLRAQRGSVWSHPLWPCSLQEWREMRGLRLICVVSDSQQNVDSFLILIYLLLFYLFLLFLCYLCCSFMVFFCAVFFFFLFIIITSLLLLLLRFFLIITIIMEYLFFPFSFLLHCLCSHTVSFLKRGWMKYI